MESFADITCRLCLSNTGKMETIFDEENNFAGKIFLITSVQMFNLKQFPNFICEFCKLKLLSADEFRTQCIKSNNILVNNYEQTILLEKDHSQEIKEELTDIEQELCEIKEDKKSLHIIKRDKRKKKSVTREKKSNCTKTEIKLEVISQDLCLQNEEDKREASPINAIEESVPNIITKNKQSLSRRRGGSNYRTMCQVCGKMRYDIKQHMTTHTGEKNYKCPHCNKGFSQRGNLSNHINIHTGNRPYKCKLCEKAFGDPNSLKSHMVTHTGERKYRCEICGNAFGYSYVLAEHIKTHIQDRRHICSFCEKPFLSREGLKKHIRIHTGEKPYKCEFCTKSFTTSWNLSTHRRVHTKERPYKCTICDMDFAYRSVLTSHMKVHASECNVEVIDESITDRDCLSELGDNV